MEPLDATSFHTLADVDAEIQASVEEIERLRRKGIALKRCRNTFVPISQLPLEILGDIFLEVVHSSLPLRKRHDWPRQWLDVSHICHHWREAVLALKGFWSHVVLHRTEELIKLFAHRSGQSLLTVAATSAATLSPPTEVKPSSRFRENFLAQNASRIRFLGDIKLTPGFTDFLKRAMEQEHTTFRALEALSFKLYPFRYLPNVSIFEGMHSLKSLSCVDPSISVLQGIRCCQLTTLRIIGWTRSASADITEWAKWLKRCPMLQILEIKDAFSSTPDLLASMGPGDIVHFPYLESLHIADKRNTFPAVHFLKLFLFPATTKLFLDFRSDYQRSTDCPLLISSLSSAASRIGTSFSGCYINFVSSCETIRLWVNVVPALALCIDPEPTWEITCSGSASRDVCCAFMTNFPLPNLRCLSIDNISNNMYDSDARSYLKHLYDVKELYLRGQPPLVELLGAGFAWAREECLLPTLELLVLDDKTRMPYGGEGWGRKEGLGEEERRGEEEGWRTEEGWGQGPFAMHMEGVLQARKTHGMPIKHLIIINEQACKNYDPRRLEGVVERVELRTSGLDPVDNSDRNINHNYHDDWCQQPIAGVWPPSPSD